MGEVGDKVYARQVGGDVHVFLGASQTWKTIPAGTLRGVGDEHALVELDDGRFAAVSVWNGFEAHLTLGSTEAVLSPGDVRVERGVAVVVTTDSGGAHGRVCAFTPWQLDPNQPGVAEHSAWNPFPWTGSVEHVASDYVVGFRDDDGVHGFSKRRDTWSTLQLGEAVAGSLEAVGNSLVVDIESGGGRRTVAFGGPEGRWWPGPSKDLPEELSVRIVEHNVVVVATPGAWGIRYAAWGAYGGSWVTCSEEYSAPPRLTVEKNFALLDPGPGAGPLAMFAHRPSSVWQTVGGADSVQSVVATTDDVVVVRVDEDYFGASGLHRSHGGAPGLWQELHLPSATTLVPLPSQSSHFATLRSAAGGALHVFAPNHGWTTSTSSGSTVPPSQVEVQDTSITAIAGEDLVGYTLFHNEWHTVPMPHATTVAPGLYRLGDTLRIWDERSASWPKLHVDASSILNAVRTPGAMSMETGTAIHAYCYASGELQTRPSTPSFTLLGPPGQLVVYSDGSDVLVLSTLNTVIAVYDWPLGSEFHSPHGDRELEVDEAAVAVFLGESSVGEPVYGAIDPSPDWKGIPPHEELFPLVKEPGTGGSSSISLPPGAVPSTSSSDSAGSSVPAVPSTPTPIGVPFEPPPSSLIGFVNSNGLANGTLTATPVLPIGDPSCDPVWLDAVVRCPPGPGGEEATQQHTPYCAVCKPETPLSGF